MRQSAIDFGIRPQHVGRASGVERKAACQERDRARAADGVAHLCHIPDRGVPVMAELDAHDPGKPGDAIEVRFDMRRAVLIDPRERHMCWGMRHELIASRAVRLFGTDEPVEPPRIFNAGDLSAEFEAGNLRYISFPGFEMIRAVSFIVRDPNWATYKPMIANLQIEEDKRHLRSDL